MYKSIDKGFSLLELAIVLAILGLFMGGAIGTYSRWVEKQLYEQAVNDIEVAKKAILGFAVANRYLPCSNNVLVTNLNAVDGVEDRTAGQCDALIANQTRTLPYATLGVSLREDPWGNPYGYATARNYSDAGSLFTLTTGAGIASPVPQPDSLNIDDGLGNIVADQVAFVIYSIGPDQGNTPTIQQNENLEPGPEDGTPGNYDNVFSSSSYLPYNDQTTANINDDTGFDDVISWVSTHVLKLYMLEAEQLP